MSRKAGKLAIVFSSKMSIESLTNYSQLVQEAASYSHETRRIPDPYIFTFDKLSGKLVLPQNGSPVENYIRLETPTDYLELDGFRRIQELIPQNDNRFIIWISPPSQEDKYQNTKIVLIDNIAETPSEISVLNRAIILKWENEQVLDFAFQLTGFSGNTDTLRSNAFLLEADQIPLLYALLTQESGQLELIKSGKDIEIKTDTLAKVSDVIITLPYYANRQSTERALYNSLSKTQLIGGRTPKCDLASAFTVMFEGSLLMAPFECPRCKGLIESGRGTTKCPHCGLTKEEAGSVCV